MKKPQHTAITRFLVIYLWVAAFGALRVFKQSRTSRATLLLLLWPLCTRAQDEIVPLKHFDRYNGLPAKTVYNLCLDLDGFVWLASENGVYRFDGKTFFPYTTVNGLADDETIEIFADSDNDIWCTGYNNSLSVIRNGVVDKNDKLVAAWQGKQLLMDVVQDRQGHLFMLGEGGYLYRADKTKSTVELVCRVSDIKNLHIHNDTLWSLAYQRVLYFDRQTNNFVTDTRAGAIDYFEQMAFHVSRTDGTLWRMKDNGGELENFFTRRRLNFTDFKSDKLLYVQPVDARFVVARFATRGTVLYDLHTDTYRGIRLPKNCAIVDAVRDNQDNVWLSAYDDGLYMLSPYRQEQIYLPGFEGNIVDIEKKDGQLTALTVTGTLIRAKNGHISRLELDTKINDLIKGRAYSDLIDLGDNGIYVLNTASMLRVRDREVLSLGMAAGGKRMLVYADSLLAFNSGRTVSRRPLRPVKIDGLKYVAEESVYYGRAFAMVLEKKERIWLAVKEGLRFYNVKSQKLSDTLYPSPQGVRIEDIAVWRYGTLLLCTGNNGVVVFGQGRVKTHINVENGLLDNNCKEIDSCSLGWIVRHPQGLSLVNLNENRVNSIVQWNGMPISSVSRMHVYGDSVFLCTDKGLVLTDVPSLFSQWPDVRTVQFFRILVDGVPLFPDSVELAYGVEKLKVDFALAEYGQPYAVEYRWQINQNGWTKADVTTLDFVNLSPGNYALQVQARAPGHDWTAVSEFHFSIRAPFWQAWWFWGAVSIVLVLAGWGVQRWLYRRRLAGEREKNAVRYQLMDFEQKALNAMMNPHFVFNAMGSIQHLLNTGNNQQANDYLVKFSRLIRKSLETSQLEFCYLDDEIERLTLYLQLEKMRFGGRMEFSIDVADDVDAEQVKIPTMILQTYVENAIIHGVAAVRHQARVSMHFWMENNILHAAIEDNGPGFDVLDKTKRSVRFGVSATEKRLELLTQLNGKPFSVKMLSSMSDEGGTRVELLFSTKE